MARRRRCPFPNAHESSCKGSCTARLFQRDDDGGGPLTWYTWVPKPEGGLRKVSTRYTDERAAHARAIELQRCAADPDGQAASKATLRECLGLLIRDRAAKAKTGKGSADTVDFYRKKSGSLLDGLAEVLHRSPKAEIFLREMKGGLVDSFITQRREDGSKDSTIAKELTTWRIAMRIAKRRRWWRGDLDEMFPSGFSGASDEVERWVTPDEFLRLRDAMVRPIPVRKPDLSPEKIAELRARRGNGESLRELAKEYAISYPTAVRLSRRSEEPEAGPVHGHALFAIVCFSIATSAEWSAIWRARREDIKPDLTQVHVRGTKRKTRKRDLPITLYAFGVLLEYARRFGDGELADAEGTFLFRGSHASSFRHRLKQACTRAGIPSLSPNDLRRTHAKWLRLVGVQPSTIAPSMGHIDSRMVERKYGRASPMELADVQRSQITNPGGMYMGRTSSKPGPSDLSGPAPIFALPAEIVCPETESNRRHGDFQSPPGTREPTGELPLCPTSRDAGGQLTSSQGTAPAEGEEDGGLGVDPPAQGRSSEEAFSGDGRPYMSHPGPAKVADGAVGARVEADGRELARTDIVPGEFVRDVEARLKLAVGQRGGLR